MKRKKWIKGKIDWFDFLDGTGFIEAEKGDFYFFHKSAFEGKIETLKKNLKINFIVYKDISINQVEKLKEA